MGAESELRLSGARGQIWPAKDKHRLEIKGGKWETQPEPAETTATENKQRRAPGVLCCREKGMGGEQGGRPEALAVEGRREKHGNREASGSQKGR